MWLDQLMPVDFFNFPSPSQIHVTLILPRFPTPLALSLLCAPARFLSHFLEPQRFQEAGVK